MGETNLTFLDADDRGVVIKEVKEDTDIRKHHGAYEAIGGHVQGMEDYQVSNMSMAIHVKGMSSYHMNQEEEAYCMESSVQGVK